MRAKIFINYRREDAKDQAARLHDRLSTTKAFGPANVFMDVDALFPGQQFDLELQKALADTDVFLAVIGTRWLAVLLERMSRGETDFVREEIAVALKRGIIVIPVLVDGAVLPKASDLPADIHDLVMHQKHDVAHESFGRDASSLIRDINIILKKRRKTAATPSLKIQGALALMIIISGAALYAFYPPTPLGKETVAPPGREAGAPSGKKTGKAFVPRRDACVFYRENQLIFDPQLQSRQVTLAANGTREPMPSFRVADGRYIIHRSFSMMLDNRVEISLFKSETDKTLVLARDHEKALVPVPVLFVGKEGQTLEDLRRDTEDIRFGYSDPLKGGDDFSEVTIPLSEGASYFGKPRSFMLCGLPVLLLCEGACPRSTTLAASLVNEVARVDLRSE